MNTNNPSAALPPDKAPLPRSREEIIRLVQRAGEEAVREHEKRNLWNNPLTKNYDTQNAANLAQLTLNAEGTAIGTRYSFELLLDIRDLMAECATRLSEMSRSNEAIADSLVQLADDSADRRLRGQ